ncbi:MAG TPA: acyl-CoA synthetase [Kofleriaceae bacterium]|nr:acyl-CoA synthetase [Kofleriaceae bacterium]
MRRHTLGDLLRRTAARLPDKPAVICGDVTWTYRALDQVVNRLANGLAARGVELGDRVAILARNSHAFVALRFALARLGAVIVPINFMFNPDEIAYVVGHAGARWLAVGPDLVAPARAALAKLDPAPALLWLPGEAQGAPPDSVLDFARVLADDDREPACPALDGRALAQIVYTSGTEARPKGAMMTHDALLWEYVSCVIEGEIAEADRVLHALPLYHCAQLDVFLGPAIYVGATNVITAAPTPDNLLDLFVRHAITSFFAPPSVWIALLRAPRLDPTALALTKGYYGASIMPVEVLRELAARLPAVRLWNFYGQTEIAPLATVLRPEDQLRKAGSAGKPVLNVETRVVDDAMRDVAVGEVGEIVHRSPQLLTGYFHDDERTAAAFAGGWFHSGDLATVDAEGYITVVDRKKDMIKTAGENVASREVEEAIYQLAGVSEVAVIGLPDPYWVEAVTAVVVGKAGHALDEAAVIAHCKARLAPFKAPKRVVFVDALPKNPSGKLLKRELRETLAP